MLYLCFLKTKDVSPQGCQYNSFQYRYIHFQLSFREMDKVSFLFPQLFWDIWNRNIQQKDGTGGTVATDKPQVQKQSIFVKCALLHDFLLFNF